MAGPWRVDRVRVPLETDDALGWLAAQPFGQKLYWHGRGEVTAVAACGVADGCTDLAHLGRRLDALAAAGSDARYLGGMRFDPAVEPAPEWAAFGAVRFVLPRFEVEVSERGATLTANLIPEDAGRVERVLGEIERLRSPEAPGADPLPSPVSRTDVPGHDGWYAAVRDALVAFGREELEKVVLARRTTLGFERRLGSTALLRRLGAAAPTCHHLLVQPAPGTAFVAATPERLFRWERGRVLTEAVAGTRPRPADPTEADGLRRDLLASDKDRREHGFVQDHLLETLAPLCADCTAGDTEALALARTWHLRTPVSGTLHPGVGPLDLLRALHPTPAVAGTPTGAARAHIAAAEGFDRGWYAGPVGWVGAEAAEFAVAIRSGLVRDGGRALDLFAGAGLVPGSDPAAEGAEVEGKLGAFARVFGLGTEASAEVPVHA